MSRWFGDSWGAPVCDPDSHVETPVGRPCGECQKPIAVDDQGMMIPYAGDPPSIISYHLHCFLASIGIGIR